MIEKNYVESDIKNLEKWKSAKVKNTIYESGILLRFIQYVHTNKILDKIIEKNDDSIKNFKEKYMNK